MKSTDQIQQALSGCHVGIAGAGGLGSNCAIALARVGLGRITVADFDVVEAGNLNRQYYFRHQLGMPKVLALKENIRLINPAISVNTHTIRLDPGNIPKIFKDCDILVEAFDKAEMKQMLIETALTNWPGRYVVAASGLAGWGKTGQIGIETYGNLILCGDLVSETGEWEPPLGPRVAIVAAMQANIVMEVLLKDFSYCKSQNE